MTSPVVYVNFIRIFKPPHRVFLSWMNKFVLDVFLFMKMPMNLFISIPLSQKIQVEKFPDIHYVI